MKDLVVIGSEIQSYHQKAQAAAGEAVKHAIKVGQLLIEAKEQVQHGEWLPFLKTTGMNPRTAQNYMKVAKYERLRICDEYLTIAEALRGIEEKNPEKEAQAIPGNGEYLYGELGWYKWWVWHYGGGYYHFVEFYENTDNDPIVDATTRPMEWWAMELSLAKCGKLAIKNDGANWGPALRGASIRPNHGEKYNPRKPITSPNYANEEPAIL